MPLRIHWEEDTGTQWAVWETTEPESFFMENMNLYPGETEEIRSLNDHKRFEWLASRHLLHLMSGRDIRGACLKDEFGKPYLEGSSYHISISHSRDMVAVMASPHNCGVDIQYKVEKIYRIADKFVSADEKASSVPEKDPVTALHVLWGAKEALYKAYGKKKLEFKTQILVDPFDATQLFGQTRGKVLTDDFSGEYDIHFRILNDLVLVYAIEV